MFAIFALVASASFAGDKEEAEKAAKQILASLKGKSYDVLWETQMSDFFKSKMTKDSFLANMTIGRQPLGDLTTSKLVDMSYSQMDHATGTKGEIYVFNYLNTYNVGKFYERIVVIKEADGNFRLAGLWGSPAPK